jgi:cyanophycinase
MRAALVLAFTLCLTAAPGAAQGSLWILGGSMDDDQAAIWEGILSDAGGGPIGVIPAAAFDPNPSAQAIVDAFDMYSPGAAVAFDISHTNPGAAEEPSVAALLATCNGFYLTGGRQDRAVDVLTRTDGSDTLALSTIRSVLASGGVIAGSSAGAAVMSDPMIAGGPSDDALLNGVGSSGVEVEQGLGFFTDGMVDQHFLRRGRMGRLIVATDFAGFRYGFGVDENSALVVDLTARTATAIGEMGTVIADVGSIQHEPGNRRTHIHLHYLETGDIWDLDTGTVTVAGNKSPITSPLHPPGTVSSSDIWDDYEAWRVMTEVVDTDGATLALGVDPNFDLWFFNTAQTEGHRGAPHTYGNSRRAYAVIDLLLNIVPTGDDPVPAGLVIYGQN